jgi:DNA mismatch repair protein MutL
LIVRSIAQGLRQAAHDAPSETRMRPPISEPGAQIYARESWYPSGDAAADMARTAPTDYATPLIASDSFLGGTFASLKYLTTVDQTFLVCMGSESLFVVDQHAAHERILFEKLKNDFQSGRPEVQRLLIPLTLEMTAEREAALHELAPALEGIGFELESFGPKTFVIRSVPAAIENVDPRTVLIDLADEFTAYEDQIDDLLSRIACHSAVRAHDPLSAEEIRTLLTQMDGIDLSSHCPHGRPTFLKFSVGDLERLFGRK